MTADYSTFQWGVVGYPLATATGRSALQDLDPALYEAINFWRGVLQIHCGARWDEECTALGRTDLVTKIVAGTCSYDPVPLFQEAQFPLPLLAVYRETAEYGQRTVDRAHEIARWGVDWILPPLSPGELERLNPFMRAALIAISDRSDYGFDPNYQSKRLVWSIAGMEWVSVDKAQFIWLTLRGPGANQAGINAPYRCLHMSFEAREQRALSGDPIGASPPALFQPLTGVDATIKSASVDPNVDPTPVVVADTSTDLT